MEGGFDDYKFNKFGILSRVVFMELNKMLIARASGIESRKNLIKQTKK
jgi:hypothetical protein